MAKTATQILADPEFSRRLNILITNIKIKKLFKTEKNNVRCLKLNEDKIDTVIRNKPALFKSNLSKPRAEVAKELQRKFSSHVMCY